MLSITGVELSSVTVLVTVDTFPALSTASIVIVFSPSDRVTVVLNEPSEPTDTVLPFTVSVTGDDVESLVVPATTTVLLFVISPSSGLVTFNTGGTVSTVNVVLFSVARFPSLSAQFIVTV